MRGRIFVFVVVAAGLFSCEPVPETIDLVQDMVVQTSYDPTTNFSMYSTYTMQMDTIGQVFNIDPDDTLIIGEYAKLVTRTVKTNLDNIGYSQVLHTQNPDLAVNVFVVYNINAFQTLNYPPGYGYPGYYYPGYYGYFGYYGYPIVTTYTSTTATLIMEMVDLKNVDSQGKVKVVWTTFIGDLITSIDTATKTREAIDQAFAQSPYIDK